MINTCRTVTLVVMSILLCLAPVGAGKRPPKGKDERARAIQVLNRLTFGPRPGDLEHVMSVGVDQWIDMQLHPESIDDHALASRLEPFRTLRMSTAELAESFPSPAMVQQLANKKRNGANQREALADSSADEDNFSQMIVLPPEQRVQALLRLSPEDQGRMVGIIRGPRRAEFLKGMSPVERETVIALDRPRQVVADDLRQSKVLRATYSERQLQEVMTDFWLNHFNVFIGKGVDQFELTSYERDVIRPHALGKFEDLLVATARSPAMQFYLDNWLSVGPNSSFAVRSELSGTNARQKRRNGLNENYGRELMELHTLGVNGGYTQEDVTEVAKVFTGWTLERPREGGEFRFNERMHEPGAKLVLGHRIEERGESEGYQVLHILAEHPSTAKFISRELAMRFVSDNPPKALVDRMAKTFSKTRGDIRQVLRTMLRSPEFWQPENYRAKLKTPLEFVVSALRATNADVRDARSLAGQLRALDMPLYGAKTPTGYSMNADAWVSSSALLRRLNFAVRLVSGRVPGVLIPPPAIDSNEDVQQMLPGLEQEMLAGEVSGQTHSTIVARLSEAKTGYQASNASPLAPEISLIQSLLLGSPEFQRR